jgi:hypothetical protein
MATAQPTADSEIRIEGIVSEDAMAQPGNWYVMFLLPWRHPDGRVIDRILRVAHDVPRRRAVAAARQFQRGVAVRVTAKQLTSGHGLWNAGDVIRVEKLPQLDIALPPAPAPLRHPLGRLVLDDQRGAFVGKRGRVKLTIARSERLLDAATARVRAVEAKHTKIRAAIAKTLVPLYNTAWGQTERTLGATAFDRALKLKAIVVEQRQTSLWYNCGSLFGDHGVQVRLTARGAIRTIGLA